MLNFLLVVLVVFTLFTFVKALVMAMEESRVQKFLLKGLELVFGIMVIGFSIAIFF